MCKNLVKQISFDECNEWIIDKDRIRHETGRYFSIICIKHDDHETIMIDQPEIGILGFIVTEETNDRKWLVQNKPEPGNQGYYQLAPTVQATKSNYERVHGGKSTPYLELFINEKMLLINTENSEQGDRFINKFNRNAKQLVGKSFYSDCSDKRYQWMSSASLKQKLQENYTVNTDARSVISTGAWYLLAETPSQIFLDNNLPSELAKAFHHSYHIMERKRLQIAQSLLKRIYREYRKENLVIPLMEMSEYSLESNGIIGSYDQMAVNYFDVYLPERERSTWQQPLLIRQQIEVCILLFTISNGIAYFNVAAYPEVGFTDRVGFGPSIQTGKGPFKIDGFELYNYLDKVEVLLEVDQSDEGSRFYQNINKYILGQWKLDSELLVSNRSKWLSLGEIELLSIKRGFLTNELRTLLSILLSYS